MGYDQSGAVNGELKRGRGGLIVTYPGIKLKVVGTSQLQAGKFYLRREGDSGLLYRASLALPAADDGEHKWRADSDKYAIITSDILCKTSRKPILSVFGVLRGRTESGIYKLQHLCLATVEAADQGEAQGEAAGGEWEDEEEESGGRDGGATKEGDVDAGKELSAGIRQRRSEVLG